MVCELGTGVRGEYREKGQGMTLKIQVRKDPADSYMDDNAGRSRIAALQIMHKSKRKTMGSSIKLT